MLLDVAMPRLAVALERYPPSKADLRTTRPKSIVASGLYRACGWDR